MFKVNHLKPLLLSIFLFILLDMIWLGLVANRLYFETLGFLARVENNSIVFNLPVGLITQAIIAAGLYSFLSREVMTKSVKPFWKLPLLGTWLGFVIYATYDLTNLSFIENWPLSTTIIDILWGSFQGFLAGWYVPFLVKRFSQNHK